MTPNVEVNITGDETAMRIFQRSPGELHRALGLAVKDTADEIFAESQKIVPVDRGTLKKSGNVRLEGDLAATVGYNTPYARAVHDGFDAQTVDVKEHVRRIQRIFGRRIPTRRVLVRAHQRNIRARRPRPYLDNAIKATLPKIEAIFLRRIRSVWEKLRKG